MLKKRPALVDFQDTGAARQAGSFRGTEHGLFGCIIARLRFADAGDTRHELETGGALVRRSFVGEALVAP